MKSVALGILLLLGAAALVTWWALESSGVAVIETRASDGSLRSTHVWFVEPEGELWLEAGTPTNPWYQDILIDPTLTFSSADRSGRFKAEPVDSPDGHDKIRGLLRQKYGLRDAWVGLLVDTSGSLAVRLTPTEAD
ncbi:MAG: hypothetical protein GY937_02890 [bacterium]|nr:hypothetical protein [bacterium]